MPVRAVGAIAMASRPAGTPVAPAARAEEEKAETTQTLETQRSRRSDQTAAVVVVATDLSQATSAGTVAPGENSAGAGRKGSRQRGRRRRFRRRGGATTTGSLPSSYANGGSGGFGGAEVVPLGVAPERAASVAGAAPTLIIFVKAAPVPSVDLAVLIHSYEARAAAGAPLLAVLCSFGATMARP